MSPNIQAYGAWLAPTFFLCLQMAIQYCSGIFLPGIKESFNLDDYLGSLLLSSFYYIYILMQMPAGALVDYFGPRKLLLVGGCLASLSTYLFSTAHSFICAEWMRIFMGAGYSFSFISLVTLVHGYFKKNKKKIVSMLSYTEFLATLTSVLTGIFAVRWLEGHSWQSIMKFWSFLLLSVTLFTAFFCWETQEKKEHMAFSLWIKNVKGLMKKKAMWVLSGYCGAMYTIHYVFIGFWLYPLFFEQFHWTAEQASVIITFALCGFMLGCFLFSRLADDRRQQALWLMPMLCFFFMVIMIRGSALQPAFIYFISFCLGMSACTFIECFALLGDLLPKEVQGVGTGFVNAVALLCVPFFQPMVGYFSEHNPFHQHDIAFGLIFLLPIVFLSFLLSKLIYKVT